MHTIQQKILNLIDSCDLGKLSLRRIGMLVGVGDKHPQKIEFHLQQLERKGFIKRDKKNKTIKRLRGKSPDDIFVSLPIVGAANCGEANIFADEKIEGFLKISRSLLKQKNTKKLFAIKAVGYSMNRADIDGKSIDEGDYVIVDGKSRSPENGNYVVSIIEDMANIKKFIQDEEKITLISESDLDMPPIYIHPDDMVDYMICGKVIQVIKKPGVQS